MSSRVPAANEAPPAAPVGAWQGDGRDRSSTQLALAVGLIGIALWRRELGTRRVHMNDEGFALLGQPPRPDGVPAEELRALLHPDDLPAVDHADERAVRGAPAADAEVRCRAADGGWRTLLTRRVAERGADGRAVALVGVALDITEQVATQRRLRRAEQRTMLAAQAVGLGIWERDLQTGDTWWDAQMYRLRGLSPDDPRPVPELRDRSIHSDDLEFVNRRTAEIVERESDYHFDFRVVWPDGSVRWLVTRGSVLRDEAGRALTIIGFNWDVTEHLRSEDIRREKTAAEQASRAKSEFLSHMSHELRTPLNAVLGFADLMLDDSSCALVPKQRERVERIRNAGRHLLALIDDVLELTSIEVDAPPLAPAPVAIGPLVDEMLQWASPQARRLGVALDSGPLDGWVAADARRLRQVLANLLSNAVKYNRVGGRVQVELVDGDEGWLGLRVRDTGRGLSPAQLQRLFEPFNRLGAEREGIEGTGIGLTIVRALVQHMGGRIEVDSEAGVGSEFRVWLRRAQGGAADDAAGRPAAPGAARNGVAIDVLYIEDNPVNVMLVEELAALRPDVRLHTAVDGHSGIARARELHPNAVLIDWQLPDMDGLAVLTALRADPSLLDVTCIALSANAMPEDIARARRSGFDDYWTKPIDFAQFLGGLDALIADAQRHAASATAHHRT